MQRPFDVSLHQRPLQRNHQGPPCDRTLEYQTLPVMGLPVRTADQLLRWCVRARGSVWNGSPLPVRRDLPGDRTESLLVTEHPSLLTLLTEAQGIK